MWRRKPTPPKETTLRTSPDSPTHQPISTVENTNRLTTSRPKILHSKDVVDDFVDIRTIVDMAPVNKLATNQLAPQADGADDAHSECGSEFSIISSSEGSRLAVDNNENEVDGAAAVDINQLATQADDAHSDCGSDFSIISVSETSWFSTTDNETQVNFEIEKDAAEAVDVHPLATNRLTTKTPTQVNPKVDPKLDNVHTIQLADNKLDKVDKSGFSIAHFFSHLSSPAAAVSKPVDKPINEVAEQVAEKVDTVETRVETRVESTPKNEVAYQPVFELREIPLSTENNYIAQTKAREEMNRELERMLEENRLAPPDADPTSLAATKCTLSLAKERLDRIIQRVKELEHVIRAKDEFLAPIGGGGGE